MVESIPTLVGYVYGAAALAVAGGVVFALYHLARYAKARESEGLVWAMGARIAEVAHAIAHRVVENRGPQLRTALADGTIDAAERKALFTEAVRDARAVLTERGFNTLQRVLGVAADGAAAYLERAVAGALEQKLAAIGPGPTKELPAPLAAASLVTTAAVAPRP